ncbi:hypothetical protein [Mudlarkpox virus]|nr:hypothetical protein [Mudlarkpox virus]
MFKYFMIRIFKSAAILTVLCKLTTTAKSPNSFRVASTCLQYLSLCNTNFLQKKQ